MLADRDFADLTLTQLGVATGSSRALVYHYFPTKAHLFGALWQRLHLEAFAAAPDPAAFDTLGEFIASRLNTIFDFYAEHRALVVVANRSPIAADPAVRGPVGAVLTAQGRQIIQAAGVTGHAQAVVGAAFGGWVAFVREAGLAWLIDGLITRTEVVQLCLGALAGAVAGHLDLDAAPVSAS